MKKYIKYIAMILLFLMIVSIVIVSNSKKSENNENDKFHIVTSCYPIYIITANITEGAKDIELVNMTDTNVGCIHDYTLSTADMRKIEQADVLIENGLGLESFIEKVKLNVDVIDSSSNITNVIKEEDEINPHIWTSISNYMAQVENIANKLSEKNPENAEVYKQNAKRYVAELKVLKEKYEKELQILNGQSTVILNESFEYLGKDLGLNITSIHTAHEESTMSAETLKNVIDKMKQNNTKMIVIDKNDDIKNAQTIANETGAKIYQLDSGLTGIFDKEAYINCMNTNLEILKNGE